MRIINLTTSNDIFIGMTKIARGLTERGLNDIIAAAYIQSSVDTGTLFLRGASKQSETMDSIRRVTEDWRRR
jgi:hypothetical protein